MKKLMIVLFAVFPILFFGCADDEKNSIIESISSSLNLNRFSDVEIVDYGKITEGDRLFIAETALYLDRVANTKELEYLTEKIRLKKLIGDKDFLQLSIDEAEKAILEGEYISEKIGVIDSLIAQNTDTIIKKYYFVLAGMKNDKGENIETPYIMTLDYDIIDLY